MNTARLKNFAQDARRRLLEQVAARVDAALRMEGAAAAENAAAIEDLKRSILQSSRAAVIDRVAYIWFNRFCALRFMDVNGYTPVRTVSPAEGATQPELLSEAKQGIVREEFQPFVDQKRVNALLTGALRSSDAQGEAYRLLLVAVCNYYHRIMPYLFEKIDDYTELLLPLDLLSEDSLLSATRRALDEDACQNVEVIGWLYQFYISERKDEVFAAKDKVSAADIPAATQLFTPNWIVRYLVENSLGRLWMLNHPQSRLVERMDYYIAPEQPEQDFLRVRTPEELRICDPACGSGHMLVYAFDLLYAIYEEAGYAPSEIPGLILRRNLTGIEIDERAGTLAAFALTMKAREKQRRFFRDPVQPDICVMQNIACSADELQQYLAVLGKNLFTFNLGTLLGQFKQAKQFGSLIRPVVTQVDEVLELLRAKNMGGQMFLQQTHAQVLQALAMAAALSPRYHVVVANPPYMGGRNMNGELKDFAKDEYPASKSDLFAMFIERGFELVIENGYNAMVTMQSWMFLSSYEMLREKLLSTTTIDCMVHMANMVMGIAFGTNATVWHKRHKPNFHGHFSYVEYEDIDETGEPREFPVRNERLKTASAADFKKIPGSPIAYWVSDIMLAAFDNAKVGENIVTEGQNKTSDNNRFLRLLWEVSEKKIGVGRKWLIYAKGGAFRKWYGNLEHVIDWSDEALTYYRRSKSARLIDKKFWYREGVTWTDLTSSGTGFRYLPENTTFDMSGPTAFFKDRTLVLKSLGLLNSVFASVLLPVLNPTFHAQLRDVKAIPKPSPKQFASISREVVEKSIFLANCDWDAYETSWDFADLPLLRAAFRAPSLAATYARLRQHWQSMTDEMQRLEEENNRIFIEAYGLQDELTPDVPLEEITLTCNPHYRYGGNLTDDQREARLLADTVREFISYAVGCMFGRYALEAPGLILANQGEGLEDYLRRVPQPSFPADRDNVIPILDGEWFSDDIVARFQRFLRISFGTEHFEANLRFIEEALGKDLRAYFLRDFYSDHVRRYQKRPIYWLFSSPSGSFNALIYMHRYRPDTVSVVLNDYLREYRSKLEARISALEFESNSATASKGDRTAALREVERLRRIVRELNDYERDVLYPLATRQVKIDLDDGVKVNYRKFGAALKPIAGFDD